VRNMTVILELKPEIEARVIKRAAAHGMPVEKFLESVIEDSLSNGEEKPFYNAATSEEWEIALDDFASSPAFAKVAGRIVDDSRESIYRETEDAQL
jgi:plasmid stability protein